MTEITQVDSEPNSPVAQANVRKAGWGTIAALTLTTSLGASEAPIVSGGEGIKATSSVNSYAETTISDEVESTGETTANDVVSGVISLEDTKVIIGPLPNLEECLGQENLNVIITRAPEEGFGSLSKVKIQAFRPVNEVGESEDILYIFRPGDQTNEGVLLSDVYESKESQEEARQFARSTQDIVDAAVLPIMNKLPEGARPRFIEIMQSGEKKGCEGGLSLEGAAANTTDEIPTLELRINSTGQVNAGELFTASSHEMFHYAYHQVEALLSGTAEYGEGLAKGYSSFTIDQLNSMYTRFAASDNTWMGKHLNLLLGAGASTVDLDQTETAGRSLGYTCYPGRVDVSVSNGTTLFGIVDEGSYTGGNEGAGHPYSNPNEFFASTANTMRIAPNSFQAIIETLPDGGQRKLLVDLAGLTFDLSNVAFGTDDAGLSDIFEPGLIKFVRDEATRLAGTEFDVTPISSSYCYYQGADAVLQEMFDLEKISPDTSANDFSITDEDVANFEAYVAFADTEDAYQRLPSDAAISYRSAIGALELIEWKDMMNSYGLQVEDSWSDPAIYLRDLKKILESGVEVEDELIIPLITHPMFAGNGSDPSSFDPLEDSYLFQLADLHKFSVNESILYLTRVEANSPYGEDSAQVMLIILEKQLTNSEFQDAAKQMRQLLDTTKPNEVLSYGAYKSLEYWLQDRGF